MINRLESVSNNKVTVVYSYFQNGVVVNTIDNSQQRIFGGYPDLLDRYRELAENFSDMIDFDDCCEHFTLSKDEYESYFTR